MDAKILDKFTENGNVCYLSSIKLEAYIKSIPDDYDSYEVQREIVKNIYLDALIKTILKKRHIPPIVLVLEAGEFTQTHTRLQIAKFKILDGLQRTFRLKMIYETVMFFKREFKKDATILEFSKIQISKKFKGKLEDINSSSALLFEVINYFKDKCSGKTEKLDELFEREQWFEIWTGLNADDEVNKMLVLNAGHKPVKTKHQLELLYRYILKVLTKVDFPEFKVIREKDRSSTLYSKNRQLGEFHFSHLITSMLSLSEGRPLTSNVELVQKTQDQYFNEDLFEQYLRLDFLRDFVAFLLDLDKTLQKTYKEIGIKWIGRETSLVGLFAATGNYVKSHNISPTKALELLRKNVIKAPNSLNLDSFEAERNSVDIAKVNLGNVNRRAVYEGITDILEGRSKKIDWKKYF